MPIFIKATFRRNECWGWGRVSNVLGDFERFVGVLELTFCVEVAQSLGLLSFKWLGLSSGLEQFLTQISGRFGGFLGLVSLLVAALLLPGLWVGLLDGFLGEKMAKSWLKLVHFLGVRGVLDFSVGGAGSIGTIFLVLWGVWGIFGGFCFIDFLCFLVFTARPLCFRSINVLSSLTNSCCL